MLENETFENFFAKSAKKEGGGGSENNGKNPLFISGWPVRHIAENPKNGQKFLRKPSASNFLSVNKIYGALKYFLSRCKSKTHNETGSFLMNQDKNCSQFHKNFKILKKIR